MSELAGLIERVEAAMGPDREVDFAIARFEGWAQHSDIADPVYVNEANLWWAEPGSEWSTVSNPPLYTSSIDAALALVERKLPGAQLSLGNDPSHGWVVAINGVQESGPSAPLAIILALLRALAHREPTNGR